MKWVIIQIEKTNPQKRQQKNISGDDSIENNKPTLRVRATDTNMEYFASNGKGRKLLNTLKENNNIDVIINNESSFFRDTIIISFDSWCVKEISNEVITIVDELKEWFLQFFPTGKIKWSQRKDRKVFSEVVVQYWDNEAIQSFYEKMTKEDQDLYLLLNKNKSD